MLCGAHRGSQPTLWLTFVCLVFFFLCLHPPREAVFPQETVFLSFTCLVSGALPASRRAREGHSVQGNRDTRELLKIPSNSRKSCTVVYAPERAGRAQAGHILPLGRTESVAVAWLTEVWPSLTMELLRRVCPQSIQVQPLCCQGAEVRRTPCQTLGKRQCEDMEKGKSTLGRGEGQARSGGQAGRPVLLQEAARLQQGLVLITHKI